MAMAAFVTAVLLLAAVVPAPLQEQADPGRVPNPVKSAWFLLWIQELVSYAASLANLVLLLALLTLLLPWLPGRAFSTKGFVIGALAAIGILSLRGVDWQTLRGVLEAASWMLIIPAVAAYLAMNYTGCATYTSLSGVRSEMRWALPLEIGLAGCGMLVWVATLVIL